VQEEKKVVKKGSPRRKASCIENYKGLKSIDLSTLND